MKTTLVCLQTILIIFHNPYLVSLSVAHICCMSVWKPSPKRTARWVTEHKIEIPIHVLYPMLCMTISHLLMTDIQRIRSCPRIIFSGYQFAYMRIKHITGNIQMKWLTHHTKYELLSTHSVSQWCEQFSTQHCVCTILYVRNISFYTNTSNHQFNICILISFFFARHIQTSSILVEFFQLMSSRVLLFLNERPEKKNSEFLFLRFII